MRHYGQRRRPKPTTQELCVHPLRGLLPSEKATLALAARVRSCRTDTERLVSDFARPAAVSGCTSCAQGTHDSRCGRMLFERGARSLCWRRIPSGVRPLARSFHLLGFAWRLKTTATRIAMLGPVRALEVPSPLPELRPNPRRRQR